MGWAEPEYSRKQVDAAGATLLQRNPSNKQLLLALEVINNWRSSHAFPLNTFQVGLRHRARQVYGKPIVAQRIKRLSSIEEKLRRFGWLSLSEMQDIGGCRGVVGFVRNVDQLVDQYKHSKIKHRLDHEDDYIRDPKPSGYRGVHLIYRYFSDRKETYNGLKIEMQFRSNLQHAWATAVETVGTFIQQALKSSRGEKDWLRFFALMGSAIALRERAPLVPRTPTDDVELVRELRDYAERLNVDTRLRAYQAALNIMERPSVRNARYFLMALDPSAQSIRVTGYKTAELDQASDQYLDAERRGLDAVLVSVESITALKRAYPNYFLDTRVFLDAVTEALSGPAPPRRRRTSRRRR